MSATHQAAPREHIGYLDGLRGIAILMVVAVHVSQGLYVPGFFHGVLEYGVRGVQLFFIVSGFTLTVTHVDRPLHPANFAARRFFRIAPMFYLGIVLYLIDGASTNLRWAPKDVHLGEVLATAAFVHDWSPTANNKVVPGGWSIACEAMFYVVYPALLLALRRLRGRFWSALAVIYILGGASNVLIRRYLPGDPDTVHGFAFSFWLTQLPAFATGCWLALRPGHARVSPRAAAWIAWAAVGLIMVETQMRGRTNLLISIGLLSLFVWAVGRARPALLESWALTALGKVSFSVYILHFFVVSLLESAAPQLQTEYGPAAAFLLRYAAALAITIPIAAVTYRCIEEPFIRFSRSLFRPSRQDVERQDVEREASPHQYAGDGDKSPKSASSQAAGALTPSGT